MSLNQLPWLVGIDEAGRGPLAGPVSVGAVLVSQDFDWSQLPGVTDSKKLTEKKREEIFTTAQALEKDGVLQAAVAMVGSDKIDACGIVPCIKAAMKRCLQSLAVDPESTFIKLDGSLKAPDIYMHQETIIKGDASEMEIGLASILAKVTRDRYMVQQAKKFPEYGFEVHKGYGTKAHREAIAAHGLSVVHRRSYCKNIKLL